MVVTPIKLTTRGIPAKKKGSIAAGRTDPTLSEQQRRRCWQNPGFQKEVTSVSSSERRKEMKRRRHRRKKVALYKQRVAKATVSEKQHIASKLRELTPGGDRIVEQLSLEER
jgi:hypothetical protein